MKRVFVERNPIVNTNKIINLIILPTFIVSLTVQSQTRIDQSVFGAGGGSMGNLQHRSAATAGQAVIDRTENNRHLLISGYWAQTPMYTVISEQNGAPPQTFHLEQNYPNPFNPVTTIVFAVPVKSRVSLKIFDLLGRQVADLQEREYEAGVYKVLWDAGALPTGVYFYRLESASFTALKKATLIK